MEITTLITSTIAIVIGAKWVYEYTENINWQKNKFLLEQLEIFHNLESTKTMEKLLDWNACTIEINGESVYIDDNVLMSAFSTHDTKHKFTKQESFLRNLFDEYFDNITKLIFMSKTGLIKKKNFIIFMQYWLKILSGRTNKKTLELSNQIQRYIRFYEFDILVDFLTYELD
jgi:hypothetical protein